MITIMRTKTFLNAIDDAYAKGAAAGANAEALKDKEDQNRRLDDMMHHGKEVGLKEGFEKGYQAGYLDGHVDGKCENGEIDIEEIGENEMAELERGSNDKG